MVCCDWNVSFKSITSLGELNELPVDQSTVDLKMKCLSFCELNWNALAARATILSLSGYSNTAQASKVDDRKMSIDRVWYLAAFLYFVVGIHIYYTRCNLQYFSPCTKYELTDNAVETQTESSAMWFPAKSHYHWSHTHTHLYYFSVHEYWHKISLIE